MLHQDAHFYAGNAIGGRATTELEVLRGKMFTRRDGFVAHDAELLLVRMVKKYD
jgi:hypothetical protein